MVQSVIYMRMMGLKNYAFKAVNWRIVENKVMEQFLLWLQSQCDTNDEIRPLSTIWMRKQEIANKLCVNHHQETTEKGYILDTHEPYHTFNVWKIWGKIWGKANKEEKKVKEKKK